MTSSLKPPDTPEIPSDFLGLPPEITAPILQLAGLHTRQVSRAFRALHPLPLALEPSDLSTQTELQAALASLPPTVTCLHLGADGPSLIPDDHPDGAQPCTSATLATMAASLPNLQELHLPLGIPASLIPAIIRTLQSCPRLHTFSIGYCSWPSPAETPLPFDANSPWDPLLAPPIAARLRSLTLPTHALHTLCSAPATALPNLTALTLPPDAFVTARTAANSEVCRHIRYDYGAPSWPLGSLVALPAVAPGLRSLVLKPLTTLVGTRHLTNLTSLTALKLSGERIGTAVTGDAPVSTLLHHIGTLTNLRSLHLSTNHFGWTPAEAGWLSRLTHLTSLQISFCLIVDQIASAADVALELATAAARLPALRHLRVAFPDSERQTCSWQMLRGTAGQPASFFQRLAAATQLRHLCLERLTCPPVEARLLASLQGLTALQLLYCRIESWEEAAEGVEVPPHLGWVSTLTNLHLFSWRGPYREMTAEDLEDVYEEPPPLEHELPPWQALASLPHLRMLDLETRVQDAILSPAAAAVMAALGDRLERLRLGSWHWYRGPARPFLDHETIVEAIDVGQEPRGMLEGMVCLQVLDVRDLEGHAEVLLQLRLPASLRRCYVSMGMEDSEEMEELQARYPLVVFRYHEGATGMEPEAW